MRRDAGVKELAGAFRKRVVQRAPEGVTQGFHLEKGEDLRRVMAKEVGAIIGAKAMDDAFILHPDPTDRLGEEIAVVEMEIVGEREGQTGPGACGEIRGAAFQLLGGHMTGFLNRKNVMGVGHACLLGRRDAPLSHMRGAPEPG